MRFYFSETEEVRSKCVSANTRKPYKCQHSIQGSTSSKPQYSTCVGIISNRQFLRASEPNLSEATKPLWHTRTTFLNVPNIFFIANILKREAKYVCLIPKTKYTSTIGLRGRHLMCTHWSNAKVWLVKKRKWGESAMRISNGHWWDVSIMSNFDPSHQNLTFRQILTLNVNLWNCASNFFLVRQICWHSVSNFDVPHQISSVALFDALRQKLMANLKI